MSSLLLSFPFMTSFFDACHSLTVDTHDENAFHFVSEQNPEHPFTRFLTEHQVRKDLVFRIKQTAHLCESIGNDLFRTGGAMITVDPDFCNLDPEACLFAVKKQVCCILSNDSFFRSAIDGTASIAATLLSADVFELGFLPSFGLGITAHTVSRNVFNLYRQSKSDDFTIENSSVEELKGGWRLYTAIEMTHQYIIEVRGAKEYATVVKSREVSTAKAVNRLFFLTSYIDTRKKIESVLGDRLVIREEEQKMSALANFLLAKYYE